MARRVTLIVVCAAAAGAHAGLVPRHLEHVPWLSDGPEPVDLVGLATKSVEGVGLLFCIQITAIKGGLGSLAHKEARP